MRVVRGRCGERFGDRVAQILRIDRFGRERAHGPAQQQCLATTLFECLVGAQPEQVLLAAPDQILCGGTVVDRVETADDCHRNPAELALDQITRGGEFVGESDGGDEQLVALRIVRAGVAVQDRQARRADRGVGLADAPRAAHRVGHDDGDGHPEQRVQLLTQRGGAGVGILGEQREFAGVDVGTVDPGCGLDDAEPVLRDERASLAGQHTDRLLGDQAAAHGVACVGVGGGLDDSPFDLRDDLAGDHEDVAVDEPRRRTRDCVGEVVAGPELGQSGDRDDLDRPAGRMVAHVGAGGGVGGHHRLTPASSSAARAISAVAAGSVMSRGTLRTATPGTSAVSVSWTSQPSRMPVPLRAP